MVERRYQYAGPDFNSLDTFKLKDIGRTIVEKKFDAISITGQFSRVRSDQEVAAAEPLRGVVGDEIPISLSHEIGIIGLVERENAAILNSATVEVAKAAARALEEALERRAIRAKLFFSQNDGTLMSVEDAERYPVLSILSGPTTSIDGVGLLTGLNETVVVDIWGTTTLTGILVNGFSRQ